MLSKIPIDLEEVKNEDLDREILRVGMIAELDAVNLYEQLAAMTGSNGGYVFSYSGDKLKLEKAVVALRARRAIYIDDYL